MHFFLVQQHTTDDSGIVMQCKSTQNGRADSGADNVIKSVHGLYWAARCALADLEGIMPEYEPSGDREHPAWRTIKELKKAIRHADKAKTLDVVL